MGLQPLSLRLYCSQQVQLQHTGCQASKHSARYTLHRSFDLQLPCCAVLVAMGAAVAFSGLLFARLGTLLPRAKAFDDLAEAAFGRKGRVLAFCTVNVAIFAAPALLHLTSAESLRAIFARQGMTHTQASVIIAAIIIPLSQASSPHLALVLAVYCNLFFKTGASRGLSIPM